MKMQQCYYKFPCLSIDFYDIIVKFIVVTVTLYLEYDINVL